MSRSRAEREAATQRQSFLADLLVVDVLVSLEAFTIVRYNQVRGLERLLDIDGKRAMRSGFNRFMDKVFGTAWAKNLRPKYIVAVFKRWYGGEFTDQPFDQVRAKLSQTTRARALV